MGEQPGRTASVAAIDLLADSTPRFWAIAIVFFGFGDLISTGIGLSFPQLVEAGPLPAYAIDQFGFAFIIPLKFLTICLAYTLWEVTPAPHDTGVPLGLAALGVVVTQWNVSIIFALL